MKYPFYLLCCCAALWAGSMAHAESGERLPGYMQAERFTKEKLSTLLFSTTVDPHWFQKGNCFWYEYKTSKGKAWYVVDPVAKTKKTLFDLDELASQITEIVKTPLRPSSCRSRSSRRRPTAVHSPFRLPRRRMLRRILSTIKTERRNRFFISRMTIQRAS